MNENYAGIKSLSDILADLLYSAYFRSESENTGSELTYCGYLPAQDGQTQYGESAC